MKASFQRATKYLILDNSTTWFCQASKVWPKYTKEYEHVCRYYGMILFAGEPSVPLPEPYVERAVGLVQKNSLGAIDERPAASIKEVNERLAEKVRVFNDCPLEIDPSLTRRT